ncbi:MAG: hypothetical protein QW778_04305 [Candidatus Micrarchaeaceae archaeon]
MTLLTKIEQKVANELSSGSVVSIYTLREIAKRKKIMGIAMLNKILHQLANKGVFIIKRGKHAQIREDEAEFNKEII